MNTVRQVIGMREYSLWVQRLTMNQEYMIQVLQLGIEPSMHRLQSFQVECLYINYDNYCQTMVKANYTKTFYLQ